MDPTPRTDAEHIKVLRMWFRNHPDQSLKDTLSIMAHDPIVRLTIRNAIDRARKQTNRGPISDIEFDRLTHLLKEGNS